MSNGYASWRDAEWRELVSRCRADGLNLSEDEIRQAAMGYMTHGSDGGGNRFGLTGTVVAFNVDAVQRERSSS